MPLVKYDALGSDLGQQQHINLSPAALVEQALMREEGHLSTTGALVCRTGVFTGRSPEDRYFVRRPEVEAAIWWGSVNQGISVDYAQGLLDKMRNFLQDKTLFVRDAYLGTVRDCGLSLRVFNTLAWHNLFCHNLFLRVPAAELAAFNPDFTIICAPDFEADPAVDGTRSKNFVIIDLVKQMILIGGTSYAGEMKKSMFTVMNYLLPERHSVLPMHCSANLGPKNDVAIFFGLSGTGKTTLSADVDRQLIGDDEHGWGADKVFNFEGGCYAKTIDLTEEKEPQIYRAIRFGTIVENTPFVADSRVIDYTDDSITENTRTAYPLHYIDGAIIPSMAGLPRHIFYLTADAFGVLPVISRLSTEQAMYHFISGYTAKVAGTEEGITEPQTVFSACFGSPFLPLHPTRYATLLGEKLRQHDTQVWLINTGWVGGGYGVGDRIALAHTRALIRAAMADQLEKVSYVTHQVFGLQMPTTCPQVPAHLLNPRGLWADTQAYDMAAQQLAQAFAQNFEKYADLSHKSVLEGAPNVT